MVLVSYIQYLVSCLQFLVCTKYKLSSIRIIAACSSYFHNYIKKLKPSHLSIPDMSNYPFQPTVTFYIDTSHLICNVNQVTCFNMKCNTWLRWVKIFSWIMFRTLYQKSCWNIVKHFEQGKTRQLHDINSQRSVNATCKNFVSLQVFLFFENFITYCVLGDCVLKLMILLFGKM